MFTSETVENLRAFMYYAGSFEGDEKGEAQVFCDRLFRAFGHEGYKEAGTIRSTNEWQGVIPVRGAEASEKPAHRVSYSFFLFSSSSAASLILLISSSSLISETSDED